MMLKRNQNLPGEEVGKTSALEGNLAVGRAAGIQRGWETMAEVEGGMRKIRD